MVKRYPREQCDIMLRLILFIVCVCTNRARDLHLIFSQMNISSEDGFFFKIFMSKFLRTRYKKSVSTRIARKAIMEMKVHVIFV